MGRVGNLVIAAPAGPVKVRVVAGLVRPRWMEFVIDRRYGISGAQPAELIGQTLDKAWAESATS